MDAFIQPPAKIPLYLRIGIWISEKITGRQMLPARILAWYPKAAVGSGVLEALVAHRDKGLPERLLKLVRMKVSFDASCPFCIDMNSFRFPEYRITDGEIRALQGEIPLDSVASFSQREKLALDYARAITRTPLEFSSNLIENVRREFTEREIVILASTASQVNYWTRLIQALGVPPAGFSTDCAILRVDDFRTLR